MKKFIVLTIILCVVINLCGCRETVVKEYNQNDENEKYELKFSSSMAVGYNCSKTIDLVSTAKTCKITDIFDIEEIEMLGEHYTPTEVGTAGGEFFAVVKESEGDTLYNISGFSQIELYKVDKITPIFEKDGNFIFAVNKADSRSGRRDSPSCSSPPLRHPYLSAQFSTVAYRAVSASA